MKDLSKYTTQEILDELLKREPMDPDFYISNDTTISVTIKFFKHV